MTPDVRRPVVIERDLDVLRTINRERDGCLLSVGAPRTTARDRASRRHAHTRVEESLFGSRLEEETNHAARDRDGRPERSARARVAALRSGAARRQPESRASATAPFRWARSGTDRPSFSARLSQVSEDPSTASNAERALEHRYRHPTAAIVKLLARTAAVEIVDGVPAEFLEASREVTSQRSVAAVRRRRRVPHLPADGPHHDRAGGAKLLTSKPVCRSPSSGLIERP